MKRILVNVVPEETRMALIENDVLQEVAAERPSHSHLVGNIYNGKVQNVLPGMEAAFVDIGGRKNAFLYIGDGLPPDVAKAFPGQKRLAAGQTLPVQVVKDAAGTKGPRVTTHLSLPGRTCVLMPTAAYVGLSRRIEGEEERLRLRKIAEAIVPEGMGLIVRTAAAGQSEAALAAEVRYLSGLWETVRAKSCHQAAPALLYRDAELAVRIVRDSMMADIDALIVDDEAVCRRIRELLSVLSPELTERVQLYEEKTPLFRAYRVDEAIEALSSRVVELPSGGFLVIDRTEALTVIDVNTGKYVGRANLGDTVYRMNKEAAVEILRQLRLRDIGGIIVVDFIDMEKEEQKEELLSTMREIARHDRIKTNIVGLSALGLVEITRKKSRQNWESLLYSDCPCCQGRGRVESPETVGVRICRDIRRIESRSHAAFGYEIELEPKVKEAIHLSGLLDALQKELAIQIDLIPRPGLHPESYAITQKGNGT